MNEPEIRFACRADAGLLSGLQTRTFWEAYGGSDRLLQGHIEAYAAGSFGLATTEADIGDPDTLFLIAEIGGAAIGYARLRPNSRRPEAAAAKQLEISRIYLLREFWGRGFGAALMNRCIAEAEKRVSEVIWLSVWQYNHRAIRFYESFGFENVGTHIFDLAGSAQTDYIMLKKT